MANVRDVAAYVLATAGPMSAFKLQKLCYYSQAWSLVWDDEPLFPERIEAWANGPVVRELYRAHHGMYVVNPGQITGDISALTQDQRETIEVVLESYGAMTGQQLSELTHAEAPWQKARARAGLRPMDRGNAEITHLDMHEFYEALSQADQEMSATWER